MSRSLARLGTLLALSIILLNCSKKEETPDPATAVQGRWKLIGLRANPAIKIQGLPGTFSELYPLVQVRYPCIGDVTLTLTANTTRLNTPTGCNFTDFEVQQQLGVSFNGTYVVEGSQLDFTSSTGLVRKYELTTSGDQMTWAYQNKFLDPDAPGDATKAIDSRVTITFQKVP